MASDIDDALPAGRAGGLLGRIVNVRPGEVSAALWAFAWFFSLLTGYYVLRPIRDEMGIQGGVETLHWSFTATFVVTLAVIPAWSALVQRLPRARAVPLVYRFFISNVLVFFLLFEAEVSRAWVARAFFVWLSVLNLLVVSVLWSVLADVFTSEQAKRLFGFVAAGGTAGTLVGPSLALALVSRLGVPGLLLVSAVLLEIAARAAGRVARGSTAGAAQPGPGVPAAAAAAPVGGTIRSGIARVFRSPYLAAIAAHLVLFTLASTFLYFTQARVVAQALGSATNRIQLFAGVDLAVSLALLATQVLATGRVMTGLGLGAALSVVPVITAAGFAVLAAAPSVIAIATFQIVRRAAHFAFDRPAREVLFTVVTREEKYKSKAFIDTVVYRGGDAIGAWAQAGLAAAGLGVGALAGSAIPLAAGSLALALWLASRQRRRERA
jgi:AAA family ATP:ADP antiporter